MLELLIDVVSADRPEEIDSERDDQSVTVESRPAAAYARERRERYAAAPEANFLNR